LALWKIINEEDAVLITKKIDARTFPADFCSRKQAKMQWIHDLSQSYVDNLNTARRDASRHFRNKKNARRKVNLRNLNLTGRSKILGTCIGASMTLKRVTNLELI
jgi:hypothetical protein